LTTLTAITTKQTRDHIYALLDGPRKDQDATSANILLKALQKTIVFEKEITAWLQREYGTVFREDRTVVAESKVKAADGDAPEGVEPLIGIASQAFEDYMHPYIDLEEQSMAEQLTEALEDRTVDTRGERPVFISSTNLFVYIKGSITRCTALTKGKAFYQLYQAFQDALRKYSQILRGKLPAAVPPSTTVVGALSLAGPFGQKQEASQAQYRVAKGEEVTICHIISTCEYCADTMEALEELIRDTIDDEYKPRIDMLNDQEVFHEITAKAIRVLVSGLTNRTENALRALSATNWSTWDAVGEESVYVRGMHEEIEPYVRTVRKLLPTSYFRSFCDKFGLLFSNAYYDSIIRLKRISEPGTQQLLLDVYNIKTLFLKLPVLEETSSITGKKAATGSSTIAPAVYTKMVQKQFGKIETLLKLVGTPVELLLDNFRVQWPDGTSTELQTIMSLKGLKRNEQNPVLEKFGMDLSTAMKGAAAAATGAAIVSERVQALQDQGSNVAAKVNSDLNQMRQKVDELRRVFK
jgi:vacuolar protein sorting-associated protein 53